MNRVGNTGARGRLSSVSDGNRNSKDCSERTLHGTERAKPPVHPRKRKQFSGTFVDNRPGKPIFNFLSGLDLGLHHLSRFFPGMAWTLFWCDAISNNGKSAHWDVYKDQWREAGWFLRGDGIYKGNLDGGNLQQVYSW